jgi:hypothetical protein
MQRAAEPVQYDPTFFLYCPFADDSAEVIEGLVVLIPVPDVSGLSVIALCAVVLSFTLATTLVLIQGF